MGIIVSLVIKSFILLITLLTLFSSNIAASNIKLAQSGPGVAGTLVPMATSTPLLLEGETVDLTFGETEAVVYCEYSIRNPTRKPVVTELGIPTISIGNKSFNLLDMNVSIGGRSINVRVQDEPLLTNYKFNEYLPLIETFNLKRRWHVIKVDLPSKANVLVKVRYTLQYLYKSEELQGRTEQSRKLFRYLRQYARRWGNNGYRSSIYIRPDKIQRDQLTFKPLPSRVEQGTIFIESQDDTRFNDATIVYDPIHMFVNKFGFQKTPPPTTLENGSAGVYEYKHLFDGDLNSNWCEGETNGGENRGFEIEWGKLRQVKEVWVVPGFGGNKMAFNKRNRVKSLNVYLAKPGWRSQPYRLDLKDNSKLQKFPISSKDKASILVVQVRELTYGDAENTTCLAELLPVFEMN